MTTFLVGVVDVHDAARLCDYLVARLDADDAVRVVHAAAEDDGDGDGDGDGDEGAPLATTPATTAGTDRDGADALNAARARLAATPATVEVEPGTGHDDLRARADAVAADEVVVGNAALVRDVLADAGRPVVVVPADGSGSGSESGSAT